LKALEITEWSAAGSAAPSTPGLNAPAESGQRPDTTSPLDLAVEICGRRLHSPLTCASGTFGSGQQFGELWQNQGWTTAAAPLSALGALTTKGVMLAPWSGNSGLRIQETASGLLNSIGLENPGVEVFCQEDLAWLARQDVPIIVNVSGHSLGEYAEVVERLESEPAVWAYELNISCPNLESGGMSFGVEETMAAAVTAACRDRTSRPLLVKLTPNVTDITEIARAVADAGADAISLINTVAGLAMDLAARRPVFERKVAGLSGPAIKPIALWAIYQVYEAVDIPLIGMGGVCTAADVLEFMLAGATLVAVGSQNFHNPLAIPQILADLKIWCEQQGVPAIRRMIGAGHDH